MANSSVPALAVEAHDLVKVFPRGNVRALDGVSLEVEAGTVLGLLGPNGAGKTTVVRILSTILGPDSGRASVLGLDVVTQAEAVRRTIGLAGQYAAVDENLTGRENIHMVARLSHLSRAVAARRANELLEEFGLAHAGDRVLKTYSGGMRRRLDLAAALVANPPVLFLDEPTTGLDPQSRQGLWTAIEELVSEGTTVLLTTQYLEEADRLARDIVVIDHGRVIAQGTPAQLKADLGTSVVSVTLGDRAAVDGRAPAAGAVFGEAADRRGPRDRADGHGRAQGRGRRAALARCGGDRHRRPGAARAQPRRRVPEPHRSQDHHRRGRSRRTETEAGLRPGTQERRDRREGCRMTTTLRAPLLVDQQSPGSRLSWAVADIATMAKRNILAVMRTPEALFFTTLQPIMFTLLFTYVFGGAIHVPGGHYIEFLMPGIFVQTVIFGAMSSAAGLAEDLHKGIIERFRALPMSRSAVLAGRTTSDLVRNVFVVVLITLVGYAVGFRIGTNFALFVCGVLVILFFAYALSWGFAYIGLSAPNAETAQVMVFPLIFPLLFASSAFVPVATMPGWLQAFAYHQPVTQVVNAARSLMVGGVLHNSGAVWSALLWTVGLLVVLAPVAVRKYRKVA